MYCKPFHRIGLFCDVPMYSSCLDELQPSSSKARRNRTAFSEEQLKMLEAVFSQCQYPDAFQRESLGKKIDIPEARIQVWFKNRRAKLRKRQKNSGECYQEPYEPIKQPANEQNCIQWQPGAYFKFVIPAGSYSLQCFPKIIDWSRREEKT